jgi:hypothetical protein
VAAGTTITPVTISPMLELDRLRDELTAACEDAGLDPATLVIWVVAVVRPPGPRFFEADDVLRDAVREADGVGYATLPSGLEANAASALFAARKHAPAELDALGGLDELRPLLEPGVPPADVVGATVAALERRGCWTEAHGDEVRAACHAWSPPQPRGGGPWMEVV